MHAARVGRAIGLVILVLGGFMATSLGWALADGGVAEAVPWLVCVAITAGTGAVLAWTCRPRAEASARAVRAASVLTRREALVIVVGSWVAGSVFSALPMIAVGMAPNLVDALFEATSGFTTTGSTILTDIESNTRAALWWRSMIQWLGGMGIIVLFVAVFPQVGGGGRKLFESEAPGPTVDVVRPRFRETGLALWRLYTAFTVVLAVLLVALGVGLFDAICHAFTTIATAGFSTRNQSIAAFDSAAVEMTIVAFMLMAGVNFGLWFRLGRGGSIKEFLRDGELRVYGAMVVFGTAVIAVSILPLHEGDLLAALRYGSFTVASMVTTTGYATNDYGTYPDHARVLLLVGMLVGAMGGSTGGGFKVSRAMIVVKTAYVEIRRTVHPRGTFVTRLGGKPVPDPVVRAALGMLVLTLSLVAASTFALDAMGMDGYSAFGASMTALLNNGPGLGTVGPSGNFAHVPDAGKLLLTALMLVGRLEFYTVLALLLPGFWRPGGPV